MKADVSEREIHYSFVTYIYVASLKSALRNERKKITKGQERAKINDMDLRFWTVWRWFGHVVSVIKSAGSRLATDSTLKTGRKEKTDQETHGFKL